MEGGQRLHTLACPRPCTESGKTARGPRHQGAAIVRHTVAGPVGDSGLDRRRPVLGWGYHRCGQGRGEDCQGSRRTAAVGRRLVAALVLLRSLYASSSSGAWRTVICAPRRTPSRGSALRPRSLRFSIRRSTSGAPSCSMPGTRRRHTGLMRCSGSTASIRCRRMIRWELRTRRSRRRTSWWPDSGRSKGIGRGPRPRPDGDTRV